MKLKYIILSFLLVAGISNVEGANLFSNDNTTSTSVRITQDDIIHTVTAGETVYAIARAYNTTVDEIYKLNPEAKDGIRGGQKLRIPQAQKQAQKQVSDNDNSTYVYHVVEKGETVYRISKAYETSIESIFSLNPELKEGLKVGMTLRIPRKKVSVVNPNQEIKHEIKEVKELLVFNNTAVQNATDSKPKSAYIEHVVKRKETIYNICKTYDVTVDELFSANPALHDGLKADMVLRIPNKGTGRLTPNFSLDLDDSNSRILSQNEKLRIGVLLPFFDGEGSVKPEKIIEYYEGFLIAMKEIKKQGIDAEIFTFDIGTESDTKRLENLVETNELNDLHFVIGGISKRQIEILSSFSKRTGARYIIPFGARSDHNEINSNVYQMTTSHSQLYPRIAEAFIEKAKDQNIIFLTEYQSSNNNKEPLIREIKERLDDANIEYKSVWMNDNLYESIKGAIIPEKNNIIVPVSSSEPTLRQITSVLDRLPEESISMFGHPEWQTYLHLDKKMFKYNTHIYSIFYLDEHDQKVQDVMGLYKKWYNKHVALSFPKFAFLGYDTGLFFASAINKYRANFDTQVTGISGEGLQSAIYVEHASDNKGGFVNIGFYIVRYNSDLTIDKFEYK